MAFADNFDSYMAQRMIARPQRTSFGRALDVLLACTIVGMTLAGTASAVPSENRYPDTSTYQSGGRLEKFTVVNEAGIWFTSPTGLRCAIGDDSSYGCSGLLPGVPPDQNEVGWFPGDSFPRQYHADEPRFDSGVKQTLLPAETFLVYRGTRCAVTKDSGVYCIHGGDSNSQTLVTTGMTYRGADALPSS